MHRIWPVALLGLLAGCAGSRNQQDIGIFTATQQAAPIVAEQYRIGVADLLNIQVFQVEDLSVEAARVDSSGSVSVPLLGSIPAAGRTAPELAADIRDQLAARYLRDPRVTVRVTEAASQKVTIDGAVMEPGVYEMKGRTTLLQAVAMAKGARRVSDLRRVAVFRNTDGQRTVAVFDLSEIRAGRALDPVLQGDDVVVVDTSSLGQFMADVVAALPGLAVFRTY